MRLLRLLGFVVLALATLGVAPSDAGAAPDLVEVQRTYLRGRDAARLLRELEAQSGPLPAGLLDMARWAAGRQSALEAEDAEGPVAEVARAVYAFRRLDLAAARKAVAAFDEKPGPAGAWSKALLQLRRGDDGGAVGRLLAPPLFEWNRDAFVLALLGAALPADDRRMLAAGALGALERCSARGRTAAIETLTLALAALHPSAGRQAYVFALRTLRRGRQIEALARLLAAAPTAGVSLREPRIALEVALTAWESGGWEKIPTLLRAGPPPAGARAPYVALRHARRRGRVVEMPANLGHVRGEPKHAFLIAQLASALGRATTVREVETWARDRKTQPSHAAAARSFLETSGFEVVTAVGDAATGDALLGAGLPFLLYRILREGSVYREVPALVRGFDRNTGLWLLVEPDSHRLDVVSRDEFKKARLLCAVPRDPASLLAPYAALPAAQRGRIVEAALDEADRGHTDAAARRITGETPVEQVYRAFLLIRAATVSGEDAPVREAERRVQKSRLHLPVYGFEAYVRAQALIVALESDAALEALKIAVRLEGPSATVAMARSVPYRQLEDVDKGLATVTEAQRLAPLDPAILYRRALYRELAGDQDGARADLRRALDRKPDDLTIALKLAFEELEARRPDAALAVLQEIARRKPASADLEKVRLARRAVELEILGNAATVAELGRLLRSPEPETRLRIAYELGECDEQEPDAAESMLRGLLADESPEVRTYVLQVYKKCDWLRARIQQDSVLARRIVGLLAKDPDPGVRASAARLLGHVDAPLALRSLAAALTGAQADPDAAVRAIAVGLLGRVESPLAVKSVAAALAGADADADPAVRSLAAEQLGRMKSPLALSALAAALVGAEADTDADVRVGVVRAIQLDRGLEARRLLVAALEDPHEDVRRAAIAPLFVKTATTRGFEPDDPPEARTAAVAKWKAWLAEEAGLEEK